MGRPAFRAEERDAATPKRVLWILGVDPTRPPDGQITYSLGLIDALASVGTDITVVHLGAESPQQTAANSIVWHAGVAANRHRLRSVASRLPAMAFTAGSPKIRRALVEELALDWDAVVLDHVQSGWALDVLDRRLDRSAVVVHVSHNDERTVRRRVAAGTSTRPSARLALELDARKVATLEDRLLRSADLVTAITYDDAAALEARRGDRRTVVLTPGYDGPRLSAREITPAVPRRAVIAGSLLWRVKQFDLLALLRVADTRFAEAGAEIVVIGETPARFESEVRRVTNATLVRGRVDSFAEEFAHARLALVSEPHGGGFKLKTLDYAFHRVPLFVQAGSVTGLALRSGHGMLEFADVESLVDGALNALDDFETLNRMQDEAYAQCQGAYDWTVTGTRLSVAIGQVAAQKRLH
jgi:glycosyltransferase involved in cell wall biosynthesis